MICAAPTGKSRAADTAAAGPTWADADAAEALSAQKCPVQAIELQAGKPVWVKKNCAMCLGCLHRCPQFAIQDGPNTKAYGQYRNPNVER